MARKSYLRKVYASKSTLRLVEKIVARGPRMTRRARRELLMEGRAEH